MKGIAFRSLVANDVPELMKWHADPAISNRYGGAERPKMILQTIQTDLNRSCLIVQEDKNTIAYVEIEKHPDEHVLWIGLVVNPDYQNRGYGKRILKMLLSSDYVQGFQEVRAGIEHDNEPSVRCFRSVGFVPMQEEPDEEGILDFIYTLEY
ncbi:MAG TPA: GNAT family N-acetyltransferase [Candidatus Peribacteraceae bacterium]|nr:GNAT family N-acetyltransferase [Candidatus Peribacteraceae bacterium]